MDLWEHLSFAILERVPLKNTLKADFCKMMLIYIA